MCKLRLFLLAASVASIGSSANLAVSTYLKAALTPNGITVDSQGNVYLAGSAVIDSVSGAMSAVVVKVDSKVTRYLYVTYLDSAVQDSIAGVAVDNAGNAYVAGTTRNPNFPVAGGGALGTPPTSAGDGRSFVTKLDAQGAVVFSALIGGSAVSSARGIAIAPDGGILVSGTAGRGFPTTTGAYTAKDSSNPWYLMKLNASGNQMIFSATGIGGSSLAFDPAGDIYMAGSTSYLNSMPDYPTTPGAYQTNFVEGIYCYGLCQIAFPGELQHVTKVDPAATTLLYSTGVNDTTGAAGNTINTGLAVDAAGNAYVTGTLYQAQYPFSVTPPTQYSSYLSKLDPTGAQLLFSIPVGGAGVQVDSAGAVYVGGSVSSFNGAGLVASFNPVAPPAAFSWIPQICWPNNVTATSEAYVMKVDAASGDVQDAQWIDGSGPTATAIALGGGVAWITGTSLTNDVPFSPGVFAPDNIAPGFASGAYLSAVDFAAGVNTGPAIACVLDSGNMTHVGPVASYQLISLFGANLGPAAGEAAPDGTDISIAGVSVTFEDLPAQLLYVSSTQINVVVPEPPRIFESNLLPASMVMKLTVDNTSIERQFPFTASNPNLFAKVSAEAAPCVAGAFQALAMNADGSWNSCNDPAAFGSTVSFFLHGVGAPYLGLPPAPGLDNVEALIGNCPAYVADTLLIDGYVYKVDVRVPASTESCISNGPGGYVVGLTYNGVAIGPREVSGSGIPLDTIVWLK